MKLVTYDTGDGIGRPGALVADGTRIADLAMASAGRIPSVLWIAEGGEDALAQAQEAEAAASGSALIARDEVRLMAPIQPPPQMRDCLCFETHLMQAFQQARKLRAQQFPDPAAAEREMEEKGILSVPQTFYNQPIYYKANRFSVVGHDHDVIWPRYSNFMDFELEFGVYIGKPAKDVAKEAARDHIFGYTIFNDFTARDAQTAEMGGSLGPAKGKDFDTGNILGPYILTADEVAHPVALEMEARVNGERWGGGNSRQMQHDFGRILEHISASETLYPGEVIGSGTVGTGCGLELGKRLAPGDRFELEIEKIGVLANRIVRD